MLDHHELVLADGLWCESLYLGDESLTMLSTQSREEIFQIFPELRADQSGFGQKVRPMLRKREARLIV